MVTIKVLKIGGSLFDKAPDILHGVESTGADVLVVPGGGRFADLVRKTYDEKSLSEDAAHWMAVLAMDEYAYYLSDKTGIELTPLLVKKKGIRIVLPYEILRSVPMTFRIPGTSPPIPSPHGWPIGQAPG